MVKRGLAYDRLKFESRPDGYSEIHRLNIYGFRGEDFAIEPTPGRRRIVMLGDSIVEGQGVAEQDTLASVLTGLLAGNGTPAELINLGVVAASLTDLTPLARDAIPLLHPDDVILVLLARQREPGFPQRGDIRQLSAQRRLRRTFALPRLNVAPRDWIPRIIQRRVLPAVLATRKLDNPSVLGPNDSNLRSCG